jgi:NDP-sugar pyrophosphorylase family protein
MIEVGGKPILEHILLRCIKLGFKNFYISTFFKSEIIEGFFEDGSKWGVNIRYLKENEPLGTAGCLSLLPRSEIKHDILMLNGDVLNEVDYISLLNFHRGSSNSATICTRNYQVSIPFGVVEQNGEGRLQVFEKPSVVRQINTGIYIFSPSVLAFLEPETYVTSPELLNKLSDNGFKIDVFPIHEYWADIGQHDQLNQAIQDWEK